MYKLRSACHQTYRIEPLVVDEQALRVVDCTAASLNLGGIIGLLLSDCICQATRWVDRPKEDVSDGIARFLAKKTGPEPVRVYLSVNCDNFRGR